ncbi:MAG: HDOD domain-containing protein [Syntrophobacteraceae bacterium]
MKTQLVLSGSYSAGAEKPEILQAFLGSCVGITLCDRKAGVGGLIHLLLPEPPSMDSSWRPEVSAATGLPIFIEALTNLGAKKHRLEACMAGGALIDPLSQTDLILDIGGRTAEIARNILDKLGIPVLQSEIGGYFSCRLSLNLATWETTIDPIAIPTPSTDGKDFVQPRPEQLDHAIETILPIPQVALKIIRMIGSDRFSFRDVAEEVIQDQVLSARILKLCNSVSINAAMRVDSVEKALLRIGEKSLLPLALSVSLQSFISNTNLGYSLCKGGLFNHSVWTANSSRKLAELTGKAPLDLAYTAGLLHDIGKVVLDQYMHSAYPLFYRKLQRNGSDLNAAERELFGIAHTDAGYRLAQLWDMPESISQTILHHHCPEEAGADRDLVHLIYVADFMNYRFMVGHDLEKMEATHFQSSIEAIEFDPAHFPALLAHPHPHHFAQA